jgi:hypothetical protein
MNISWRIIVISCAFIVLSGCTLYPVPEDVTGVDTYNIVRQIRCETREAVRDLILTELKREATDSPDQPANPIALRLVQEYEADREQMDNFSPNIFSGQSYIQFRNFYNVIYSVGIAYNFDLTMNEENDVGTMIDALGAWAPKFTLGFGADVNRGRSNERSVYGDRYFWRPNDPDWSPEARRAILRRKDSRSQLHLSNRRPHWRR